MKTAQSEETIMRYLTAALLMSLSINANAQSSNPTGKGWLSEYSNTPTPSINVYKPSNLIIATDDGTIVIRQDRESDGVGSVVTILSNGQVIFGQNYKGDASGTLFWQALAKAFPSIKEKP